VDVELEGPSPVVRVYQGPYDLLLARPPASRGEPPLLGVPVALTRDLTLDSDRGLSIDFQAVPVELGLRSQGRDLLASDSPLSRVRLHVARVDTPAHAASIALRAPWRTSSIRRIRLAPGTYRAWIESDGGHRTRVAERWTVAPDGDARLEVELPLSEMHGDVRWLGSTIPDARPDRREWQLRLIELSSGRTFLHRFDGGTDAYSIHIPPGRYAVDFGFTPGADEIVERQPDDPRLVRLRDCVYLE
jgi:hypothetical protein